MEESDNKFKIILLLSYNESDDGNEHSNNENFNTENVQEITLNRRTHTNVDSIVKEDSKDSIWSKESKTNVSLPFTEHVGPKNITQDMKIPGDFFLCLLSQKNIELIIEQTNIFMRQKIFLPMKILLVKS